MAISNPKMLWHVIAPLLIHSLSLSCCLLFCGVPRALEGMTDFLIRGVCSQPWSEKLPLQRFLAGQSAEVSVYCVSTTSFWVDLLIIGFSRLTRIQLSVVYFKLINLGFIELRSVLCSLSSICSLIFHHSWDRKEQLLLRWLFCSVPSKGHQSRVHSVTWHHSTDLALSFVCLVWFWAPSCKVFLLLWLVFLSFHRLQKSF